MILVVAAAVGVVVIVVIVIVLEDVEVLLKPLNFSNNVNIFLWSIQA